MEEEKESQSRGGNTCLLAREGLCQALTLAEETLFLKHGLQLLLLECPGLEHLVTFLL